MSAIIKVGDREMTVAEARAQYVALREVFGEKTGLGPQRESQTALEAIKEWTQNRDDEAKKIASQKPQRHNDWQLPPPVAPHITPFIPLDYEIRKGAVA